MHKMEELKENLCRELEDVGKEELSVSTLDIIDKLTHSIKSIETILAMEGYSKDNSYDRGSYDRGSYDYSGRRDSMGRYARRYSRTDDEMKYKLEDMKRNADENTRRMIDEWLKQIQ